MFLILMPLRLQVSCNLIPFTRKFRLNYLLIAKAIGIIFWLQPGLPIRGLVTLPTATILIAVLGWWLTSRAQDVIFAPLFLHHPRIAAEVLIIALTRYFSSSGVITPSRRLNTYLSGDPSGCQWGDLLLTQRTRETRNATCGGNLHIDRLFVGLKHPL